MHHVRLLFFAGVISLATQLIAVVARRPGSQRMFGYLSSAAGFASALLLVKLKIGKALLSG